MDPVDYGWWLAARAAGITSYVLLSASIVAGLAMAMRLVPPVRRKALITLHQRLALLGLGAIAAHGALLLGDSWLDARITQILVPFTIDYRPAFTGLGVLAGYLAALLGLSFYVRRRIGGRRWRNAHRLTPVAWAMASAHALGSGSDAGSLWLLAPMLATIGAIAVLVAVRWTRGPSTPAPKPPARRARAA